MKRRLLATMFGFGAIMVMSAPSSAAVTDKEYGIFIQCAACAVTSETDELFGQIQSAIGLYTASMSADNMRAIAVGDMIQIESYHKYPGGYGLVDHYFKITSLPVSSWSNLSDLGYTRDNDEVPVLPNPLAGSTNDQIVDYLGSYNEAGGTVTVVWGGWAITRD